MERAVEALIAQPLAKAILEGGHFHGPDILGRAAGEKVVFEQCQSLNAPVLNG